MSTFNTPIQSDLSIAKLGKPGGFAPLGLDNKVPGTNLPTAISGGLSLQGGYDASTNTPDLTNPAQQSDGALYITTVAGTQDIGNGNETFTVGDAVFYTTVEGRWYCLQGSVLASEVVFNNAGTPLTAPDVQTALVELSLESSSSLPVGVTNATVEVVTQDPTELDVRDPDVIFYNETDGNHFISYKVDEFERFNLDTSGLTPNTTIEFTTTGWVDLFEFDDNIRPGVPYNPGGSSLINVTFKNLDASSGFAFVGAAIIPTADDANVNIDNNIGLSFQFVSGITDVSLDFPNVNVPPGYKLSVGPLNFASAFLPATDVSGTIYPDVELTWVSNTNIIQAQRWNRIRGKDRITNAEFFINMVSGDDAYNGLTAETAVRTQERAQELLDSYCFVDDEVVINVLAVGTNDNLRLTGQNISFYSNEPVDTFLTARTLFIVKLPAIVGNSRLEFTNFFRIEAQSAPTEGFRIEGDGQVRFIYCGTVRVTSVLLEGITNTNNEALSFHYCDNATLAMLTISNQGPIDLVSLVNVTNTRQFSCPRIDNGEGDINIGVNGSILSIASVTNVNLRRSGLTVLRMLTGRYATIGGCQTFAFIQSDYDKIICSSKTTGVFINTPSIYLGVNNGILDDFEAIALTQRTNLGWQPASHTRVIAQVPGENKVYLPSEELFNVRQGARITIENSVDSTEPVEVYATNFIGYHFDLTLTEEYDSSENIRYYPYRDLLGSGTANTLNISTTNAIAGANGDDVLYQSGTEGSFTWNDRFDDYMQGIQHRIVFKWAEIDPSITGPGQRLFNVVIDGVTVESNVDIYAKAGGNDIAVDVAYTFVPDASLTIDIVPVVGRILVQSFYIEPIEPIDIISPSGLSDFYKINDNFWIKTTDRVDYTPSNYTTIDVTGGNAHLEGIDNTLAGLNYVDVNSTGPAATADGANSIAIGSGSFADGNDSIVIGQDAFTNSGGLISIGSGSFADGDGSMAIGNGAITDGVDRALSVGTNAIAEGQESTAVGHSAYARSPSSIAFGYNAIVQTGSDNSVQLGAGTNSTIGTLQYLNNRLANAEGLYTSHVASNYSPADEDNVTSHLEAIDDSLSTIRAYLPETDIYVRADGNDSNSGFADVAGEALATLDGAFTLLSQYRGIPEVTINLAANTVPTAYLLTNAVQSLSLSSEYMKVNIVGASAATTFINGAGFQGALAAFDIELTVFPSGNFEIALDEVTFIDTGVEFTSVSVGFLKLLTINPSVQFQGLYGFAAANYSTITCEGGPIVIPFTGTYSGIQSMISVQTQSNINMRVEYPNLTLDGPDVHFIRTSESGIFKTGTQGGVVVGGLINGASLHISRDGTGTAIDNVTVYQYDNSDSGLTATNYKDAIDELAAGAGGGFPNSIDTTLPGTLVMGTLYAVDVSLFSVIVNTPSTPTSGDRFAISDAYANSSVNNITVDFTTVNQPLHGLVQNYVLNEDSGYAEFLYIDTTIGWIVKKG